MLKLNILIHEVIVVYFEISLKIVITKYSLI